MVEADGAEPDRTATEDEVLPLQDATRYRLTARPPQALSSAAPHPEPWEDPLTPILCCCGCPSVDHAALVDAAWAQVGACLWCGAYERFEPAVKMFSTVEV